MRKSQQNDKTAAQLYRNCTQILMSISLMQTGKLEREREMVGAVHLARQEDKSHNRYMDSSMRSLRYKSSDREGQDLEKKKRHRVG